MVYPEEPYWALPPVSGIYDDGDYRGKIILFLQIAKNPIQNALKVDF